MKFLYILRHAKSSKNDPSLMDFDRPLNSRGLKTAPLMGRLAFERKWSFDVILSSPAIRAKQTAELFAREAHFHNKLKFVKSFYPGEPQTYLEVLAQQDDTYQSILVVGHNLALENLLEHLVRKHEPLPTAALAQVELPIRQWTDLSIESQGRLITILKPKEILKIDED
ncbi:MAG: histidine phosphatase family protein [Candidatus Omnitrophica bacterium]|nr:histidine phosphatase family protein [Candidatus Omnitrophota bacterium]